LEVSDGLVPGPAICPGAGAAGRPQEILHMKKNLLLLSTNKLYKRVRTIMNDIQAVMNFS
jgi:hypothetical protein